MEGGRGELTAAQMEHLMTVIAGMESVKGASSSSGPGGNSPPPTDEEIRQFIDYMGQGVVNQERLDFEASREQPEPPKRSKTAQQYFWRRHYLSIISGQRHLHQLNPLRGGKHHICWFVPIRVRGSSRQRTAGSTGSVLPS